LLRTTDDGNDRKPARLDLRAPAVELAVIRDALCDHPRKPFREHLSVDLCRVRLPADDTLAGQEATSAFVG
jgi:hypothetical protein